MFPYLKSFVIITILKWLLIRDYIQYLIALLKWFNVGRQVYF